MPSLNSIEKNAYEPDKASSSIIGQCLHQLHNVYQQLTKPRERRRTSQNSPFTFAAEILEERSMLSASIDLASVQQQIAVLSTQETNDTQNLSNLQMKLPGMNAAVADSQKTLQAFQAGVKNADAVVANDTTSLSNAKQNLDAAFLQQQNSLAVVGLADNAVTYQNNLINYNSQQLQAYNVTLDTAYALLNKSCGPQLQDYQSIQKILESGNVLVNTVPSGNIPSSGSATTDQLNQSMANFVGLESVVLQRTNDIYVKLVSAIQNTIQTLQNQIQNCSQTIQTTQSSLATAAIQITDATKNVNTAITNASAADSTLATATKNLAVAQSTLTTTTSQVNQAQLNINQADAALLTANKQLSSDQATLQSLKQQLATANTNLKNAKTAKDRNTCNATITSLQTQITNQNILIQNDKTSCTNLTTKDSAARTILSSAQTNLTSASVVCKQAQQTYTTSQSAADTAHNNVETSRIRLSMLQMNQSSLQNNLTSLKNSLQTWNTSLTADQSFLNALQADTAISQSNKAIAVATTNQQSRTINAIQVNSNAYAALQSAKNTTLSLQTAVNAIASSLVTDQAADNVAHADEENAQASLDALNQQQSTLADNLNALQTTIEAELVQLSSLEQSEQQLEQAAKEELASNVADAVTSSIEAEAEKIGYAKMFVSFEIHGTDTIFIVHYRNPSLRTAIDVQLLGDDGRWHVIDSTTADTPVADGWWQFQRAGASSSVKENLKIVLHDPDSGQIFSQVSARFGNVTAVDTPQYDFSYEETGMLEESPITPDLKVVSINGATLLLQCATPHDQLYVETDMGGFLSQTSLTCKGGTSSSFVTITLDTGWPTGDYHIYLENGMHGTTLKTINIHKEGPSITVSNTTDMLGASVNDPNAQTLTSMIQQLRTLRIGAFDDPNILRIQSLCLFEATNELTNPSLQLYVSADRMLSLLFQQFPTLSPTYIDTVTGKLHDDLFNQSQLLVQRYTNALNAAEPILSNVFQNAVNMFVKIYQGQPEGPLKDQLHALVNSANQNQNVQLLYTIPGFPNITYDTVCGAAQLVFETKWEVLINMNQAAQDYLAYCERQRDLGKWQTAQGEWVDISNNEDTSAVTILDTEQLRLATKILDVLLHSSDARIIAYNNATKQELALKVAAQISGQAYTNTISNILTTTMNQIDVGLEQASDSYIHSQLVAANIIDSNTNTLLQPDRIHYSDITNKLYAQQLHMQPNQYVKGDFSLSEDGMMNLSLTHENSPYDVGATLSLCDASGLVIWSSAHAGASANTISGKLRKGSYSFVVTTSTVAIQDPLAPGINLTLTIESQQETGKERSGMISLEGNMEAMPVSMRVAEFDTNGRRIDDLNFLHELDTNKPVWVVIHGMNSSENSAELQSVERELSAYGSQAGQVVTINWEEAARSTLDTGTDAPWTKAVGEWIAHQLIAIGFDPQNINLVGHSHGTYVSFAAAQEIMNMTHGNQINALVALDPAGNIKALSGFDDSVINFSAVSRNSIAIEGSLIAGSNVLAATADTSFGLNSLNTLPIQIPTEHGEAITTFSNILRGERLSPGQYPAILSLYSIMTPSDKQVLLTQNVFRGFYEGIITISMEQALDGYGSSYLEAIPSQIEYRKTGSTVDDILQLLPHS